MGEKRQLLTRLEVAEHERVKAAAQGMGISVNEFVRRALVAYAANAPSPTTRSAFRSRLDELGVLTRRQPLAIEGPQVSHEAFVAANPQAGQTVLDALLQEREEGC